MTHIVELRASNFARLSAVTIRPDGSLVQITGKNSAGKTSVLNAIWSALKGRAVAPPKPIHAGTEEARLRLDLGTMVVTRTFKRDKHGDFTTDLKVMMADGSRVSVRPQALIDGMLGDLSFDPLEFARLAPKDQFERVKKLVPGFDFAENARQSREAFDQRTDENRGAKALRAQADGVALPPGPKPAEPPATDKLLAEMRKATADNDTLRNMEREREDELKEVEALLDEAEQLRARATTLERQAAERKAKLEGLKPLPKPADTSAIAAQIAQADDVRRVRAQHEQREQFEQRAEQAEARSAALTAMINKLDAAKREAIAAAKMPVKGLSFGEEEVLLNGLPFAQAGTAAKIKASMAIGMSLNPDLRVMLVDEGSELDTESLALVAKMAEEHDYQVWVARVAEGAAAKVGFEIVDGTVAQ